MTQSTAQRATRRQFRGTVVSDAMEKTVTVRVETQKMHPKYKKRYKVTTKYLVHDPREEYAVGETVEFVECRPISRHKRWRVVPKTGGTSV
ncbi:MAG: 30S ribosomal protein S17 [Patescibacteria group bacterium]